ncbi:hypothetical protein G7Y79_00029g063600 [Physcia stellaris]|nr:hypothetical protein G7Y79_00029g063600 [Physcia stellaris]
MASQYDTIATAYDALRQVFPDRLERAIVEQEVISYIRNASVLDLACGTGFYTQLLSQWGAARIVGVDQSHRMLDIAKRRLTSSSSSAKITYVHGDCAQPRLYEGAPFDFVFAGWLLNYASNAGELAQFFRTIATNLKAGGMFVGVVPHPTDDPKTFTDEALRVQPKRYGGIVMSVVEEVEDGVKTHLYAPTEPRVEFDNYHLRRSVYESAAKVGGMDGELKWVKARKVEGVDRDGEEGWDWEDFLTMPFFAILVVHKE